METVPTLWAQILGGYIAGANVTDSVLEVTYRPGDGLPGTGLEAVVDFDAQTHAPLTGELFFDGTRVALVRVTEFQSMGPQG